MKTETFASHLVVTRCLSLLFYNFTQDDIKHLRKVHEFDHVWTQIEYKAEKKKWSHIPDTEFYNLFVNTSYETQANIIELALERYQTEAENSIGYSMQIQKMRENMFKKQKTE